MKRHLLVLWGGLLWIAGSAAFIGAVQTKIYGHDIFVLLDNGWKVLNGLRVHTDYASPYGPVTFLISALGLALTGESVNGVGVGNALFAILVGSWVYFAGRGHLRPALLTVACLSLAALVASPYPLGLTPFDSSHAMVYNRFGYALLGLVLIGGGVSTGVALALALFLKASFFAVGVGLVGLMFLLRRPIGTMGVLFGFLSVSLVLLWYLHFDMQAIARDLSMAAGARGSSIGGWGGVFWKALPVSSAALEITLLAWVISLSQKADRARLLVVGILIFGADILLLASNAQGPRLPLMAMAAIVYLNRLKPDAGNAATLALAAVLFVPQLTSDVVGLAYGDLRRIRPASGSMASFTSARLRGLVLNESNSDPESNGRAFTTYVNEGVALLEKSASLKNRVLTMDMTNPFPYALGWRPPRAGFASATYNSTLNGQHHPSADLYFGDADIVMVPRHPAHDVALWTAFYQLYEPDLRKRFHLEVETDWWQLWSKIAKAR